MSIAVEPTTAGPDPIITLSERNSDPVAGTGAWWVWECPRCGSSYEAELDVCIEDGTPLRKVGFSLPFIWIG